MEDTLAAIDALAALATYAAQIDPIMDELFTPGANVPEVLARLEAAQTEFRASMFAD